MSLRYPKAGVALNDLVPEQLQPRMLFATRNIARPARVMTALNAVKTRYGRGTLRPLATGVKRPWATRHDPLSQCQTNNAAEMLVATAW
jgi:DNA polymerase V